MKIIVLVFLFVFSGAVLNAQTIIYGGNVKGVWKKADSPFKILGAIRLQSGESLEIEPGVRVEFNGHFKFLVQGKLKALGSENDTIVFTSLNKSEGWFGIRIDVNPSEIDSIVLRFCKIEYGRNTNETTGTDYKGGGLHVAARVPVEITNCRFTKCYAAVHGGAIYVSTGNVLIKNCLFDNNTAGSVGAVRISGDNVVVQDNVFRNNESNNFAAALGDWGVKTLIEGNVFIDNMCNGSEDYTSGALYCSSDSRTIVNRNLFMNNKATNGYAGAVYSYGRNVVLSNNIIANNESGFGGGAVYFYNSNATMINNTICNNYSSMSGGAIFFGSNSKVDLKNNILWGNKAKLKGNQVYVETDNTDPNFFFNDIEGGQEAFGFNSNIFFDGAYENNISQLPEFINPPTKVGLDNTGEPDFRIVRNSPCIDAGQMDNVAGEFDFYGNSRVINSVIDIGAIEYDLETSIEGYFESNQFKLFPNPASDFLYIKNVESILSYSIRNQEGKIILQGVDYQIDVRGLSSGLYFIEVMSGNQHYFEKVLVDH